MKKISFVVPVFVVLATGCGIVPDRNEPYTTVHKTSPSISTTTPPASLPSATEWKTYKNDKYSFEIQYPGGMLVNENTQEPVVVYFGTRGINELEIRVKAGRFDVKNTYSLLNSSKIPASQISQTKSGPYDIYTYEDGAESSSDQVYLIPRPAGSDPIVVSLIFHESTTQTSPLSKTTKDKIVGSLKFSPGL